MKRDILEHQEHVYKLKIDEIFFYIYFSINKKIYPCMYICIQIRLVFLKLG